MKRRNFLLLLFVSVSSILLITINFYTIKILSGVRAYINGESQYSKGQKDASLFLTAYINTGKEQYWKGFNESMVMPLGNAQARIGFVNKSADSIIEKGFLMGRNHPVDVPDMIWLYKKFQYMAFMKNAMAIWTEGDGLTKQLNDLGNTLHSSIAQNTLTAAQKEDALKTIVALSSGLSVRELDFSDVMSEEARKVKDYLLWANMLCIIVIIGNITFYVITMVNKIVRSKKRLEAKNVELSNASKELDTFIYSLSHDLRSPITSVKGLIYIAQLEKSPDVVKEYLTTIDGVIDMQDAFIKEIIDFFRNKRMSVVIAPVNVGAVIADVINNNKYMPQAQQINIETDITIDTVQCDELRLKMILNNLLSNAIKYSDEQKPQRWIKIRAARVDTCINIEVEDNGVGIEKEYFEKIFQMFFVTPNNNHGTGLGLYILQQNVEKLEGKVSVTSEVGKGTCFTISLPCA